ncbi:hypothetical protein D3C84_644910 [compost metagenome]
MQRVLLQGSKRCFTGYDLSADAGFEACITVFNNAVEHFVLDQFSCCFQAPCEAVHTCDVSQEEVVDFERATANFRVKVYAATAQAACFENFVHRKRRGVQVRRELVRIPAEEHVALVRVERAQHAVNCSNADFVLERVASQRSMVRFKVQLEVLFQAVVLQECNRRSRVEIVLVFRRLFRLRLDQELCVEADFFRVCDRHVVQASQIVQLQLHVRVQKRLVTFAAAPEYIVFSAELFTYFKAFLYLCCSVCVYVSVNRRACAVNEARVREHVLRVPEQLSAGRFLAVFEQSNDNVEVLVRFLQRRTFWSDITVMESVERNVQLLHELEVCFNACFCFVKSAQAIPSTYSRTSAEWIRAVCRESVPVCYCITEVLLHRFAEYDLLRIVMFECKRIVGAFALEFNLRNVSEISHR